tara:strand:- start:1949 stop:2473 length:525 start_codon:yes stop_codon:yes gene_type:complete
MSYKMEQLKVLVVEDNWHMRALTRSLLNAFGIKNVDAHGDAESAYSDFLKERHDLIIIDWMMEPIDGIELTRMIRTRHDSPDKFVPIILMTGYSEKMRVMQARDAGITEFLVKPFTSRTLYTRIEHIIEKPRQFVKSKDYFGPDRRRIVLPDYDGEEKRDDDESEKEINPFYIN